MHEYSELPDRGDHPNVRFRIFNWLSIVNHLGGTLANRQIKTVGLSWPQFTMLTHFSHFPREYKTVMGISRAMQQNQPAVSKTVRALVEAGLVREEQSETDARSRRLYLTEKGLARQREAVGLLVPHLEDIFSSWEEQELQALFTQLDRLREWLDRHRVTPIRRGRGNT